MFTVTKHTEKEYKIITNKLTLGNLTLSGDCLLEAMLSLLRIRKTNKTICYQLKNALHLAIAGLDSLHMKNFLLEPSKNVSVNNVIAGYKAFERRLVLESCIDKSKASISSAFRSLLSDTNFRLSDGTLIGQCGFVSSIRRKIRPLTPTPCYSNDIQALRIRGENTTKAYVIFDPDALPGLMQSGGLLDLSLQQASKLSQQEPLQKIGPQHLLLALQTVTKSTNATDIKKVLNSQPGVLNAIDVLKGFTQLEDILQSANIKLARSKSAKLRSVLELGGKTLDGIKVSACEFSTRFLVGDKIRSSDEQMVPMGAIPLFSKKGRGDKICHYIEVNCRPTDADALLNTALTNLSIHSEKYPLPYPAPLNIRNALSALFGKSYIKDCCSFLFAHFGKLITDKDLSQEAAAAHEIIDCLESPKNLAHAIFSMLSQHSDLGERAITAHKKAIFHKYLDKKERVAKEVITSVYLSAEEKENTATHATTIEGAIVHPHAPEIQVFIEAGGLLEMSFLNTKWDVFLKESQSTEPYHSRSAVSKALRFLAQQVNIPYIKALLTSPPNQITPRNLYQAYKEVESVLLVNATSANLSRALRGFIERNAGEISHGHQVNYFSYRSRFVSQDLSRTLPCNPKSHFTLQKLNMRKLEYFPFDNDILSGLMRPGTLLSECLLASESTPMNYTFTSNIYYILKCIAHSSATSLKLFLHTKRCDITQAMVIDALIEFETLLSHQKNLTRPNQKSNIFRMFLARWAGSIGGASSIHKIPFQSRFDASGKVKCISPFTLAGIDSAGQQSTVKFDTYRAPNLFKKQGLLAKSLLTARKLSKAKPLPITQVQQWSALVEHFINKQNVECGVGMTSLLSSKLSKTDRRKLVKGLKAIENLIELRNTGIHDTDFHAILSLLSLSGEKTSEGRLLSEIRFTCRFSPTPTMTVIQFNVKDKRNGKNSTGIYDFDITDIEWRVPANGMLMVAIQRAAKESLTAPLFRSQINTISNTIKILYHALNNPVISIEEYKSKQALRNLLTSQASHLRKRDVILGLKQLEDILEQIPTNKNRRSENFRYFLSVYGGSISNGLSISHCKFKSRFSASKEQGHSELIIPVGKNGKPLKSPIIQSHVSTKQLKEKINEYYQKPIDAIIDACKGELALYYKLLDEVNPLIERSDDGSFSYPIPEQVRNFVGLAAIREITSFKAAKKIIEQFSRKNVLAAFLQLRADTPMAQVVHCPGKSLLIGSEFNCWFKASPTAMAPFFWTPFLLPRQILLICFIRIMIHTTWNKDVIASLTHENLPYPLPAGRFFIQGYKDKVGKSTKHVEVTPAQSSVKEAIELLGKHHENMVKLGMTPQTIWETPHSDFLSFLNASTLDAFRERYDLPKFTIEQLAKHMIKVREGVDGDIRRSQEERNHTGVKTTAGYVDHPLSRAFHDANNAEFQRRLETMVQVRYGGVKSLPEFGLSKDNIDLKLLENPSQPTDIPSWFILPDGSTCKDIWATVDKASKSQRLCGGRKCHSGDGCPYNTVIIGPEEFANTLRKRCWFIERCDSLLLKHTREYFDEYIAPEMRFVFGLSRYIEVAEPEFYQQAEQLLNSTQGGDE